MKPIVKTLLVITSLTLLIGFSVYRLTNLVLAEQSGSSPESGAVSRIKTIYDSLVSLSHGSDSAGGWGNWGAIWNRIRSAAEWTPSGDATEADVVSGKTFYKDSRTEKSGTASPAIDWSLLSFVEIDDYEGIDTGRSQDYTGEESAWLTTAIDVKKDTRTGLYWADPLMTYLSNQFSRATCDFFTSSPRGSYTGGDSDCGNAINACANLSREAITGDGLMTDWYLPTYKEQMQAYIDGIYNQNSDYGGSPLQQGDNYWSSTEFSVNATKAWYSDVYYGTNYGLKSSTAGVQCIRRD